MSFQRWVLLRNRFEPARNEFFVILLHHYSISNDTIIFIPFSYWHNQVKNDYYFSNKLSCRHESIVILMLIYI